MSTTITKNATDTRDKLAVQWLGLVGKIYEKMTHLSTVRRMGYDDARSAGILGLLKAAETYDPSRGVPFQNYASLLIRNTILGEAIEHHSGPTRMPRTANKNMSAKMMHFRKVACSEVVSLSEHDLAYVEDERLSEFQEKVEKKELPKEAEILSLLEPYQRRIVEMKLLRGMTFAEIASQLERKVTAQAVSWQYHKALKLLRGAYASKYYTAC